MSRSLALSAAGLALACNVYDTSLLEDPKQTPVPEGEWGSGIGWWSAKTSDGCVRAGVPSVNDRPQNAGGDGGPVLLFAIRSMALGSLDRDQEPTEDAWQTLGFDLDGVCTNSKSCPGENKVSCTSLGTGIPFDGLSCRDNTFGRLEATAVSLPGVGKQFGLSNDGFNCALCNGNYNFVIQLSDWNGEPDDSNVRIDFYPSPGTDKVLDWECSLDDPPGAWRSRGCWTAQDRWTLANGSFDGPIAPEGKLPPAKLNDPSAYVRQGYVVGQLPSNASFWFPGDRGAVAAYPLKIQQGVFAGKITQKDGVWRIEDGTIAGRAKKEDIIGAFEDLGFCQGHEYFGTMLNYVSSSLDVLASGAVSEEATCDSLSVGIGFEAEQADVSRTAVDVAALPGCPVVTDGGAEAGADGGADAGADGN
jgi:hypothetical protein